MSQIDKQMSTLNVQIETCRRTALTCRHHSLEGVWHSDTLHSHANTSVFFFSQPSQPSPIFSYSLASALFLEALAATLQKVLASAAAVEEASTCLLHLLPHWLCYAAELCASLILDLWPLWIHPQAGPTQAAAVMVQGRSWNCGLIQSCPIPIHSIMYP